MALRAAKAVAWLLGAIGGYTVRGAFPPFGTVSPALALSALRGLVKGARAVAEVGVGSGYVTIELLKEAPWLYAVGIDMSRGALEACAANARAHGVHGRLDLVQCHAASCLRARSVDVAFSNPPYLPCEQALCPEACAGPGEEVYRDILLDLLRVGRMAAAVTASSLTLHSAALNRLGVRVAERKTPVDRVWVYVIPLTRRTGTCKPP